MSFTLWRHARIATMAPGRPWGWIDDGALLVQTSAGVERCLSGDLSLRAR